MSPDLHNLEIEAERTYVVYNTRTGLIVHIHKIITHCGAEAVPDTKAETRALELASHFGHRGESLRVLRADNFDPGIEQRLHVGTLQFAPTKGPGRRRLAKRTIRKSKKAQPRAERDP
jgi:hypothetical protein